MKNILIPILVFFLCFQGCSKDEGIEDDFPTNPVGPSNPIITKCYPLLIVDDFIQSGTVLKEEFIYTTKGFVNGYKFFYGDSINQEDRNYQHDENGNVTYFESFDIDGKLIGKSTTTFSTTSFQGNQNPLLVVTEFVQSGIMSKQDFTYTPEGYLNGSKIIYDGSIIQESRNYQHNKNGNVIYVESFDKDGDLTTKSTTTFSTTSFQGNQNPLLVVIDYVQGAIESRQEFTYTSEGFANGYKYFYDGVLNQENRNYQYDENGNVTYVESFDKEGVLITKTTSTFTCFQKKTR